MLKFTFEWNAVITLNEAGTDTARAEDAECIHELAALHGSRIDLGIVTTAASENTKKREFPKDAAAFDERLREVGLDHLGQVLTIGKVDLTFIGRCRVAREDWKEKVTALWEMIPDDNRGRTGRIPQDYREFAKKRGIDPGAPITSKEYSVWRNKWCDVYSIYAHVLDGRDVFVTGDTKNFRDELERKLKEFGVGKIMNYADALDYARTL